MLQLSNNLNALLVSLVIDGAIKMKLRETGFQFIEHYRSIRAPNWNLYCKTVLRGRYGYFFFVLCVYIVALLVNWHGRWDYGLHNGTEQQH